MTRLQAAAEEIADIAVELLCQAAVGWERDKLREDVRRRAEACLERRLPDLHGDWGDDGE